ncbi:MAG: serine/threonine protein kinase [Planctomycetota bacterium]
MPRADYRIGELAVRAGFLSESDLEETLLEQERRGAGGEARLGELMVELGYVSPKQLKRLFNAQIVAHTKVTRIGPYHLIAKIGEGGMGTVYQARDMRTGELVALKVLPRSKARDPEFLARFEQEGRAVFKLDHPNVVRAIGLGEADGYHYFAMEYVEGKDVYDMLDEAGRIPEIDALSIVIQITQALDHAYEHNVVHRDIKPGNILVDRYGMAKLTDFGLALDRDRIGRGRITAGHDALGTPFYLSPEQARGEPDVDIASDIYSLGATLYEMVTGHPPFEGSPAEVLSKHLSEQIPSPRDIDRTLTPGVCHVIQKMMAKHREDRYPTPRELMKDIMLVYQGRDPLSERLPSDRSSVRASIRPPVRKRPRPAAAPPGEASAPPRAAGAGPAQPGAMTEPASPPAPAPAPAASAPQHHHPRVTVERHADRGRRARAGGAAHGWNLFIGVAGGLGLVVALAAVARYAGSPPARVSAIPPPSGKGTLVRTDFESGRAEGWEGRVYPQGAGEGKFSLRAIPDAPGLAARLKGAELVAGEHLEIAFLYFVSCPGPLAMDLLCTVPARGLRSPARLARLRCEIANPVRGEWAVAHATGEDFADAVKPEARLAPGWAVNGLVIRAPGGGPRDVLALDAVWIWTDAPGGT